METIYFAFIVIGIIWTILTIILFFKIWGMCDNVKDILRILLERKLAYEDDGDEIKAVLQKHKKSKQFRKADSLEDIQDTMMAFNDDCFKLFKRCESKKEFDNCVDEIISKYNKASNFDYSTLKEGLWEQFTQL